VTRTWGRGEKTDDGISQLLKGTKGILLIIMTPLGETGVGIVIIRKRGRKRRDRKNVVKLGGKKTLTRVHLTRRMGFREETFRRRKSTRGDFGFWKSSTEGGKKSGIIHMHSLRREGKLGVLVCKVSWGGFAAAVDAAKDRAGGEKGTIAT